jgi:hypothetical protein
MDKWLKYILPGENLTASPCGFIHLIKKNKEYGKMSQTEISAKSVSDVHVKN